MSTPNLKQLILAMRTLSTQAIMFHQSVADMLHLNITDYKCLDLLIRFGPMTAGKLAEQSGLTTGTITVLIDRLEKAGYVKRKDNPKDRRSVIVDVIWNKKNKLAYEKIFIPLEKKLKIEISSYKTDEVSFFVEFINKEVKILREETKKLSELVQN